MCAALAGAALFGSVPARAEWLEAKSEHFTVYADMSEKDLRQRVERLEAFDGALRGLFKQGPEDPATIYIVGSTAEIQRLANSRSVAGFYSSTAQGSQGFVPERLARQVPGFTAETILFHEYTHHALLNDLEDTFPGWMHEGFAELFMTARFADNGDVIIGAPNTARGYDMNGVNRWSVRRLIESDQKPPRSDEVIERYTRGWALLHYLTISGERPGQYGQFMKEINAGTPAMAAAEKVFGDLDKLNNEVNAYLRSSRLPTSVIGANVIGKAAAITVAPVSAGKRAILPFRMRSAVGVNDDTALPLAQDARPVAASWPNDPFVQRTMTEIEYDAASLAAIKRKGAKAEDFALADAAADRALAADKNNVMAMVYKGRIAGMLAAGGDSSKWAEARRWFLAANRADPDHALPLQLYYQTFIASGQPASDAAVTGMRRAVVIAPADTGLRAQLGVELARRGELADAKRVLRAVAYNPHAKPGNKYTQLMDTLDSNPSPERVSARIAELKLDHLYEFKFDPVEKDGEDED